ncbi:PLP-dependent aminotransferase family protein [Raoultibacter phocaeensis]|uniref:MocR-like pyridoxine biosynthesis transcription factor PdxR n=1 Tax=Raoultibacter phocaeensis TaxID=2479841 RepID=UPI00111B818E|nr:PLP-dependent aminotransferase family protein [Raoultibacter phocaeensis]
MLTYPLDRRGEDSLYTYLYKCIRADIETGVIAAREKLPSKRALARHLGVSLITVEGAYAQLIAEGYVYSLERKGYFASPLALSALSLDATPARPSATIAPSEQPPHHASDSASAQNAVSNGASGFEPTAKDIVHPKAVDTAHPRTAERPLVADFTGNSVAAGLFPYTVWARTIREALAEESEQTLLGEAAAAGSLRLRESLARHLSGFRGMQVAPEQIVVGAGAQTLYTMIVQLLGRNRRFAVEDPGYPRLTRIYQNNDVALSHVSMDDQGVAIGPLRACEADVLHIMPSHQFPTGRITSISRRYELLGWASECKGRTIIEDDYDCEFRLAGRPIPPLQAIDASDCVIYTNTFTKSLGPAFRIGYMVLPEHLAAQFARKLGFYSCTVSTIDQLALARFIDNGDYERHVNRMRSHYRTVRNELVDALKASPIAPRIAIESQDSGLHFILGIESPRSEEELAEAALAHGVALAPLTRFYQSRTRMLEHADCETPLCRFVMSYSGIARETIDAAVQAVAKAVG